MNIERRADSFAKEVAEHLEKCGLELSTEKLLSAGYYWGIHEVMCEIEMLLVKAELQDLSPDNTAICKAIRNYIKSVV